MSNRCFLRPSVAKKIENWILNNGYSLQDGHFILEYLFTPGLGEEITIKFIEKNTNNIYELVVQEIGEIFEKDEASVSEISIDYIPLSLKLEHETLKKYSVINSRYIEPQVEESVEPNICDIRFEIHSSYYVIYANKNRELIRIYLKKFSL